jgi:Rho termination factor, N-terminal domain
MNKAELESKHIAELHALAAEAEVPRYRMLRREELIEKLADGEPSGRERSRSDNGRSDQARSARPRRERSRPERSEAGRERPPRRRRERPAKEAEPAEPAAAAPTPQPEPAREPAPPAAAEPAKPRRKRRRRRFGRRSKGLQVHDLLTPPPGRQALVYGESRAACTTLLREIAAELAGASDGPDPIALLIDPSPEELADWKREAPQAEIVAAGQVRHASDALAQASRRAEGGEDVILLVDSLSRLADGFGDAEEAKELFDAGLRLTRGGNGSLTVVAALERPQ